MHLFFKRSIYKTDSLSHTPLTRNKLCVFALTVTLALVIGLTNTSQVVAKSTLVESISASQYEPLVPTKAQIRTSVNILDQLSYQHYHELEINDQLSEIMLNRYLNDLDPSKLYLLEKDIQLAEQYRFLLDDALRAGNLKPGFEIFNIYQVRAIQRFNYAINLLENQFDKIDFSKKESMVIDREEVAWAKTTAELDELWRKRVKSAVLSLLLTEKPLPEIQELLTKRYKSKLNRVLQNRSEDAFQLYINSLTQSFDPHTQYFSPRTSENFNINMSLSLEGIGAVLQNEDDYTKVVRLVPGGPADKSKLLHPSDRIIGVSQDSGEMTDIVGWRIDEVVQLIRGPKGSTVRLQIIPSDAKGAEETQIVRIVRDKVKLEDQAAQKSVIEVTRKDKTFKFGVIDIPTFYIDFKALHNEDPNFKSTTRDVAFLIHDLKKEKIDGLVIDLRSNGGGSLQEANTLLGLFIKKGPTVQVKDDRGRIDLMEDNNANIHYKGPLVVIVNRLSASASEIFAGAIQDYQRGLVVGSQTFGKGTVQALRNLNRGQLKITQAKFYRISGESNQHQGIIPDILFPSLFDVDEIGESALERALPWDRIKPARYKRYQKLTPYIPILTENHQERIKKDPDFQHLIEQLEFAESIKNQEMLSLNKADRISQKAQREETRLALENKRRAAKGLELLEELEEEEEDNTTAKADEEKDKDKPDAILNETANILTDFILIPNQRVANF